MLSEVSPGRLWVAERPLRFFGLEVGTRMSVVRLSSGDLWLHSPVELTGDLRRELGRLGPVRFVVCPNRMHHTFVEPYFSAYPAARVYASPGLPEKRPELPFSGVLGDAPEPGWAEDLDQLIFRGERLLREVVFFHRGSRSLIVTDLLQNVHPESPPLTRLAHRPYRTFQNPGPPLPVRFGLVNKAAARASLERTRSWDFERIVLAHGSLVETGGKAAFLKAFSFLG